MGRDVIGSTISYQVDFRCGQEVHYRLVEEHWVSLYGCCQDLRDTTHKPMFSKVPSPAPVGSHLPRGQEVSQ